MRLHRHTYFLGGGPSPTKKWISNRQCPVGDPQQASGRAGRFAVDEITHDGKSEVGSFLCADGDPQPAAEKERVPDDETESPTCPQESIEPVAHDAIICARSIRRIGEKLIGGDHA